MRVYTGKRTENGYRRTKVSCGRKTSKDLFDSSMSQEGS